MNTPSSSVFDPVTFEVLNHRLLTISEEMGINYMRCSGSNVLITGNDAASAIMDKEGGLVSVGPYIVTQGNVLPLIVQSTLNSSQFGELKDGDIFICNDPYMGAIHAPDFATVSPIFYEEKLVAWVGASGHQLDTGGMDPGGFSVKAVDIHQEGLRMPPVKLVDKGQLREDVLEWIINQVRDPLVGLDVRGQVACLTAGRERILGLIDEWGIGALKMTMEHSIEFSSEKLRDRLEELPDGEWREVQHIDHDGHEDKIYQIVCTLTKTGKSLTFDFSGTSPNAKGLINCTYSGLQAAVLSAVYINLCWDIPWNRGIRDCIDIVSEVGTVNNCSYPAPCAMATISGVIVTIDASWRCLSQMLLASEGYQQEAMAVWSGTSMAPIFAGTSQHGFSFAATEMSHFGGGGGARTYADGVDTSGIVFNTTPNMPNIEDQESEYPVLYLYRRHLCDSGGAGKFRGGRSGELAYTAYEPPENDLVGLFAGTGAEMPNAIGLAGGMPGNAILIGRLLDSDIFQRLEKGKNLPSYLDEIVGTREIMRSKHERVSINTGDVWHHCWQAGGGYGDPLLRDEISCATDVLRGAVSKDSAHRIYGVVLNDDGTVDGLATKECRQRIREDRLNAATSINSKKSMMVLNGPPKMKFGDVLYIDDTGKSVFCSNCQHELCSKEDNLLDYLVEIRSSLSAAGPVRGEDYDHGRFHLRQICCAKCATLIDVQVVLKNAPLPSMKVIAS